MCWDTPKPCTSLPPTAPTGKTLKDRGGGCGSVTVLPQHRNVRGPSTGHKRPDTAPVMRSPTRGGGCNGGEQRTDPTHGRGARGCGGMLRSRRSRTHSGAPRCPPRPVGVSSAGRGYRSPGSPAGARPSRAAGARRNPGCSSRSRGSRPDAAGPSGAALPGPPFPPAARPRQSTARGAAPGRGALSAGAGLRPPARPARSMPVPVPAPYGTWPGAGRGAGPPPAAWCCPRQRPRRARREGRRRRDRPALPAP